MDFAHSELAFYIAKAAEYRTKAVFAADEDEQRALAVIALGFVTLACESVGLEKPETRH
jgi:hypothetical protein